MILTIPNVIVFGLNHGGGRRDIELPIADHNDNVSDVIFSLWAVVGRRVVVSEFFRRPATIARFPLPVIVVTFVVSWPKSSLLW